MIMQLKATHAMHVMVKQTMQFKLQMYTLYTGLHGPGPEQN